jgi:hypothetical protein
MASRPPPDGCNRIDGSDLFMVGGLCFHRAVTLESPWVAMMYRSHVSICSGARSGQAAQTTGAAAVVVLAAIAGIPSFARADEGGGSFWQPGSYESLAAVPDEPGWSFAATYTHVPTISGSAVAAAREISIGRLDPTLRASLSATVHATSDTITVSPSYAFATPVLGARAVVSVSSVLSRSSTDLAGTLTTALGPVIQVRSDSISDSLTAFGDLAPLATLYWNKGVHNFMVYGTANLPVGSYLSSRLTNIGLGHGAMDVGGGYTYLNYDTGYEFSAVGGLTYNLINPTTNYQSGVDFHLDWGASRYLTDELFVGPVGYLYEQLGCDSGSGDKVGCFQSRVAGLGAQVGYSFPVGKLEGYMNLKGYGDFAAENRASGWSVWLTFSISPPEPAAASSHTPMLHK